MKVVYINNYVATDREGNKYPCAIEGNGMTCRAKINGGRVTSIHKLDNTIVNYRNGKLDAQLPITNFPDRLYDVNCTLYCKEYIDHLEIVDVQAECVKYIGLLPTVDTTVQGYQLMFSGRHYIAYFNNLEVVRLIPYKPVPELKEEKKRFIGYVNRIVNHYVYFGDVKYELIDVTLRPGYAIITAYGKTIVDAEYHHQPTYVTGVISHVNDTGLLTFSKVLVEDCYVNVPVYWKNAVIGELVEFKCKFDTKVGVLVSNSPCGELETSLANHY